MDVIEQSVVLFSAVSDASMGIERVKTAVVELLFFLSYFWSRMLHSSSILIKENTQAMAIAPLELTCLGVFKRMTK